MNNKLINNYVRQFKENQNGTNWLDEHFKKKLEDIKENDAFVRPTVELHSVAELVWHIYIWRIEGIKKLNGLKSGLTVHSPSNWRSNEELKKIGWKNLIVDFYNSQDKLVQLIKNRSDTYLENEYVQDHSYKHLIEGLVHHDIYHLGQLGITIKLLKLFDTNQESKL